MHSRLTGVARRPPILPDVLARGLAVVFCGTAPGTRSARERAYYAHPGNYFWRTLFATGLTSTQLPPSEFRHVLDFQVGLTDVAKHTSGSDAELPRAAFDAPALAKKLGRYRPAIIAFTSKNAARAGLALPATHALAYGMQSTQLAGCRVFVLPSPSGQARGFWDIAPWHTRATAVRAMRHTAAGAPVVPQ